MNCLSNEARAKVISCLVEGCSIRATVRMTGVALNTIAKLLADIGCACVSYHNQHVRNLKVRRLQADEIWCFVGAKAKNTHIEKRRNLDGAIFGRGWESMLIRSSLFPIWSATRMADGRRIS